MRETSKSRVVVVARGSTEAAALANLVADPTTAWACSCVQPKDVAQSNEVESAIALVVDTDAYRSSPFEVPTHLPIIACGQRTRESEGALAARVSAWIERPSAPVLRALLHDTLGPLSMTPVPPPAGVPTISTISSIPPSSTTTWRRKSDMIIGRSLAVRSMLDALDRFAASPAPVAITGESGSGKELVARALHYSSPRSGAPFIALNLAAIPESLFEAELFGYVRGAFTGAVANRTGAFEGADRGTLFLDEIGEMPASLQPKLLRVLERGEITRLGSNESKKVTVRVVTATHRDLEREVRAGNFRQDLFYRLRVCHVHVPPLRDRLEDIAPLVAHHLSIIAARENRSIPRLSPEALEKMLAHRWPGNVRELVNVLEAAVLMTRDNVIAAENVRFSTSLVSLAPPPPTSSGPILPYKDAKAAFEVDYFNRVLRAAHGNISLAAKLAQKTRKEIYEAIRRVGIEASAYRDDETV